MITAERITKFYGQIRALTDVSFHIARGEIIGLVGPNGAGKTTTMKILTGYIAPTRGRVAIDGIDVIEDRLSAQRRVGYLPESSPLYGDMHVQDYLRYIARLRDVPRDRLRTRLSGVVAHCGLGDVLTRPIRHLSKGFRQRVGLAQAMVHDPDVLILDEPTSGLDPNQIFEIRDLIRHLGREKTVILSTHILSEVEATCHRALMIIAGQLAADQPIGGTTRAEAVTIRILGDGVGIEERLRRLPVVKSTSRLATGADGARFRVETNGTDEAAAAIAAEIASAGARLSELVPVRHSLEEIFRERTLRLTGRSDAAPAAGPGSPS